MEAAQQQPAAPEGELDGMSDFLDSLKWDADGLVAVIAQVGTCSHDCTPVAWFDQQPDGGIAGACAACGHRRGAHAGLRRSRSNL